MVTATARRMTAEQFAELPDDGFRYELVRGELKKMSPAKLSQGEASGAIIVSLGSHVIANRLGKVYTAELGFILGRDPDHVRVPDVSFISTAKLSEFGQADEFFPTAPDVAIEIISPSDRYTAVDAKSAEWLDGGARAVVVVNPRRRTVSVRRSPTDVAIFTETDTLEVEDVIPGWRMPVRSVFDQAHTP